MALLVTMIGCVLVLAAVLSRQQRDPPVRSEGRTIILRHRLPWVWSATETLWVVELVFYLASITL